LKVRVRSGYGLVVAIVFSLALSLALTWFLGERISTQSRLAAGGPLTQVNGTGLLSMIVLIIFFNALFIAAETAIDLLKSLHVRHVRDEDEAKGRLLQDLLDHKQRYATACTLGSRMARILIALIIVLLATSLDLKSSEPFLVGHFLINLAIVAIPISLVNLVVGELVPKSYATLHPHQTGIQLYGLIRSAGYVFSWPASALVSVANLLTRRFGGKASFTLPNQAEEEILTIVESAGEIEVEEKELIASVFDFTDMIAREVMTPRVDVDALSIQATPDELVQIMRESGHSRIPLYEETYDQIVGIIHAKDLLMAMVGDKPVNIRTLMRTPLFVPEGKDLHELLREMRVHRSQMAVVQDEFGGTSGIVTIEDIVEELVGDIVDEYDQDEPEVVEAETGGFFADGRTHLDDVNDEVGSDFESDEFDTIGGYVFGLFGRQPKLGEEIDSEGYRFRVEDTDGRRILRLRVKKVEPPED
jgi:putative hemolysin